MDQVSAPPTRTPGLTSAEVADRVRDGRTNDLPARSGRTTGEIVRANVFTRINAILGILLAIVLTTGKLINAAFGLLIIANSAIGDELTAHARIDVEVWARWRVSPTTGLEQWIPEAQMDPMYRTRTRTR